MVKKQIKEKVYQSRRVWAACLTLLATTVLVIFPENYELISMIGMTSASILGIHSWKFPKK